MNYSPKHYFLKIDELPIWNWWQVSETGNLIYLHKTNDYSKSDYKCLDLWENLNDQYFEEYGINDALKQLMRLKKKWITKKTEYLCNENRFALTELDIIEGKMKDLESTGGGKKEDTIIALEEKLSREINPKELSVKKYFDYLNYYFKR